MGDKTGIEWTDATWNPIVGCSVVSPGCTNCYAMRMAARIERITPASHYAGLTRDSRAGPVWTGEVRMAPEAIVMAPLRWRKPRRIFVNSMGDLFHEAVPDEWVDRVFAVMALSPHHTFQVLTKRPDRMRAYLSMARAHPVGLEAMQITLEAISKSPRSTVGSGVMLQGDIVHLKVWPLPNVWLGTSAESVKTYRERWHHVAATPAAVRMLSAEPLLGDLGDLDLGRIGAPDWVIVGGESGEDARPMHPDWARSIRDQCAAAGVPFFFKQWGEWKDGSDLRKDAIVVSSDGRAAPMQARALGEANRVERLVNPTMMRHIGKKRAGRSLDGVTHTAFPEART